MLLLLLLLLLWYILRGLTSSKGLIGGLSSVVQKKQDNRKEIKTKRKKKVKKKTRGKTEEEKSKQTRRRKDRCTSSGLKVRDLEKIYLLCRKEEEKTWRKKHCDSEIWQRPWKSVPETDRKTEKGWQVSTRRCKWKPKRVRRLKGYFCLAWTVAGRSSDSDGGPWP